MAVRALVAHVKEGAVMAQFEGSPKRLDAVGVCLPTHRLAYAVLHQAVLAVHALILSGAASPVCADLHRLAGSLLAKSL